MNSKNSFTYVISSDERTNSDEVAAYYDFNFGGTETGDMEAQKDAAERVFKFLLKLEND